MRGIKDRWRDLSKIWRLVICIAPPIFVLGAVGGANLALGHFAENPSACGTCHLMQSYVDSYYKSNFLDRAHGQSHPAVKCKDCHSMTLIQQSKQLIVFVTGSYKLPLKQTIQGQELCIGCHPDYKILGALRKKPKFVEDPSLSFHLRVEFGRPGCRDPQADLPQCQDCHRAHGARVNYCTTCHYSFDFDVPDSPQQE
jgi:hypothetical protein